MYYNTSQLFYKRSYSLLLFLLFPFLVPLLIRSSSKSVSLITIIVNTRVVNPDRSNNNANLYPHGDVKDLAGRGSVWEYLWMWLWLWCVILGNTR